MLLADSIPESALASSVYLNFGIGMKLNISVTRGIHSNLPNSCFKTYLV